MGDTYIRELEVKVAQYEATMSRCPQCKTTLPTPEADSINRPSRQSRSHRPAQQPTAKVPPPACAGPSKRTASTSTPSRSSKQLHRPSQAELQPSYVQQSATTSAQPAASNNRSHQPTEVPVSPKRHPLINTPGNPVPGPVTSSEADFSRQPVASSQATSARPSSIALSTAHGKNQHSGTLINLDSQKYRKPKARTQTGRPPGGSVRHAEWMRSADIMLEEVPSGWHWREKLIEMDRSVIAAVAMGDAPISERDASPTEDVERQELIRLVRRFAQRHSEGRVNFEQFILVCLCKVLSSQGVSRDKIVETLQICISDTSQRNIDRYLQGVSWANKMMNELFLTGWGYRAVDLIAIWNRSIATYGKLAGAHDSRRYFITELTQRKYFDGYQGVPDRRHDTIPWVVKKELGNEVAYRDICKALGYSDEYILKTRSLHSSQPPSPSSNSGSSVDGGESREDRSSHAGGELATHASSRERQPSADELPIGDLASALNMSEDIMLRRQLCQGDSPVDSGGHGEPSTSESIASQGPNRIIPDRSAKPLANPKSARRQREPHENLSSVEVPVSTSLGESAPSAQSSKRSLPDSPTSAFQPINAARRRHHVREISSRDEMGPPSHSGKIGSNRQEGGA